MKLWTVRRDPRGKLCKLQRYIRRLALYPAELQAHIHGIIQFWRKVTYRLGGERSILLSYGGIYEKQEIFYSKSPGLSSVSRGFLAVGSAEKGVERADKVEPGDGAVQVIAV